jgi:hypothetical protein
MKAKVKDGQTLADIAVQEFGAWEAMLKIAQANGRSMTDTMEAGEELQLPDGAWNKVMQTYCKNNAVSPATARDNGNVRLRIFGEEFTEEFE